MFPPCSATTTPMRFHEYIIYKTGSSHIAVKFQPLLKSQAILAESHFLFESDVVLLTVNSQSLVQKSLTVSAGDVDSDSCLSTSSQLDLLPAQNPQVIGDVPMVFLWVSHMFPLFIGICLHLWEMFHIFLWFSHYFSIFSYMFALFMGRRRFWPNQLR